MNTTHKGQMVHAAIMQTFAHIVFELFANTAGEHRIYTSPNIVGEHRFLDTFRNTVNKCQCALVTKNLHKPFFQWHDTMRKHIKNEQMQEKVTGAWNWVYLDFKVVYKNNMCEIPEK